MSRSSGRPPVGLVVPAVVLAGLLHVGARRVGPVPALGPFLDPANGVWGVTGTAELPDEQREMMPGLEGEVRVVYDDRRVPHIYASSVADAYRAQGWVVARDRLFQLELQARATAGSLTELVGAAALEADRGARWLALADAAEREWVAMAERPDLSGPLNAYAQGVSAYLTTLGPADRPLEYHLLGAEPAPWEPQHSLYLLKRMGWTLSFATDERRRAAAAALVGREAAEALFPIEAPIQEPIVPYEGTRYTGVVIPPPGPPDPDAALSALAWATLGAPLERFRDGDGPVLGSNNWAVGPDRSATGTAILAGDPHLGLTLPSIWYEVHLVVPGELDVYGVALVGMPGVVIGFNRDVAWTFTNTPADAVDVYREQLDDDEAPRRYMLDGAWRELELRVEEYRDPRGTLLATDTLYRTHRGPVQRSGGVATSIRWTVLEQQEGGQGEIEALTRIGPARSVEEWLAATSSWFAPIQNGLVADRAGRIGIRSAGFYPVRPDSAAGIWVQDGTTSRSDWVGRVEIQRVPTAVDPEQGFLASANQQPVDPEAEPTYLGTDWPSPWRAMTINGLLRSRTAHSPGDLAAYQTWPTSARAEHFVPAFLEAAGAAGREGGQALAAAAAHLASWDLRYDRDNLGPVLFEAAMDELGDRLWDELEDEEGEPVALPGTAVAWALLGQPGSPWWDDRDTEAVETRDRILAACLEAAWQRLLDEVGEPGPAWRWGDHRTARILHLLGIPAFSRTDLSIQGGPGLLNPSSGAGTHGASWRMVVELGEEVRARGVYPGGQSGNPLSPDYADRIPLWVEGQLAELRFPAPEGSLEGRGLVRSRLTVRPGGGS